MGRARDIVTMEDSFELLFSDEMFDLLVLKTNFLINRKLEILRDQKKPLLESSKYPYLRETSRSQMHVLIGFMYLRGLHGLKHHKITVIFSGKFWLPIFATTSPRERVKFPWRFCLLLIEKYTFQVVGLLFSTNVWAAQIAIFQSIWYHYFTSPLMKWYTPLSTTKYCFANSILTSMIYCWNH